MLLAPVTLLLAAVAAAAGPTLASSATFNVNITTVDFFTPGYLRVNISDTVTFRMQDADPHLIVQGVWCTPSGMPAFQPFSVNQSIVFTIPGLYEVYDASGTNCRNGARMKVDVRNATADALVDTSQEIQGGRGHGWYDEYYCEDVSYLGGGSDSASNYGGYPDTGNGGSGSGGSGNGGSGSGGNGNGNGTASGGNGSNGNGTATNGTSGNGNSTASDGSGSGAGGGAGGSGGSSSGGSGSSGSGGSGGTGSGGSGSGGTGSGGTGTGTGGTGGIGTGGSNSGSNTGSGSNSTRNNTLSNLTNVTNSSAVGQPRVVLATAGLTVLLASVVTL